MPGKVKVKIISGRNLPVMDRSSDTTDAYVEIKLGSTTYKTDVCRKSLHPQWNSEWYRFEVDDAELQDEPLQIRLMDHDTYSANDAIGKVYLDLNPLLLPATSLLGKWNDGGNSSHEGNNSVMTGWIPVYDTMHGIRGEVNVVVKVELFTDFNKFRQSSCGVQFFCSPAIPHGFYAQVLHGFVEELVVNDDPEYQWIDKIRTPRASNEARQTLFCKLSGELQRKIGLKALDMGGNAVIGYNQCFDLEGESGIVARGIGTAVTLIKILDEPNPENSTNEERAQNYLKFLGSAKSFYLNKESNTYATPLKPQLFTIPSPTASFRSLKSEQKFQPECMPKLLTRHLSDREFDFPLPLVRDHTLHHSVSLQTLLKQEDMRGRPGYSISQKFKNLKFSSQNMISRKMIALKQRLGNEDNDCESVGSSKRPSMKYRRTHSDNTGMAEILVRSVFHAATSLDCIAESPKISLEEENAHDRSFLSLPAPNLQIDTISSNTSCTESSSSADEDEDDDEDEEEDLVRHDTILELDTVSHIVETVRKLSMIQSPINLEDVNYDENKFLFVIGGEENCPGTFADIEDGNLLYYEDTEEKKATESFLPRMTAMFQSMKKSTTAKSLSNMDLQGNVLNKKFTSLHNIHQSTSRVNKYSEHGGKETVLGELFRRIDSARPLSEPELMLSDVTEEDAIVARPVFEGMHTSLGKGLKYSVHDMLADEDYHHMEQYDETNTLRFERSGLRRTKPKPKLFQSDLDASGLNKSSSLSLESTLKGDEQIAMDDNDRETKSMSLDHIKMEEMPKKVKTHTGFLPRKVLNVLHKLDAKWHHKDANVLATFEQEHKQSTDIVSRVTADEESTYSLNSDDIIHKHGFLHKLKEGKDKFIHGPKELLHKLDTKIHHEDKGGIKNDHGLLNMALGNVLMDSVQEVLVTSHTDSPDAKPFEFPLSSEKTSSNEDNSETHAPVTPHLPCHSHVLDIDESETTSQLAGDELSQSQYSVCSDEHKHGFLHKLKEGKDKLIHKIDTKIHHHEDKSGIKHEHGLLSMALGNVLMDSVQEVLATSHTNSPEVKPFEFPLSSEKTSFNEDNSETHSSATPHLPYHSHVLDIDDSDTRSVEMAPDYSLNSEDHKHGFLHKLKEGKDKLIHKIDPKVHHEEKEITNDHGLLNMALGNVLIDSVQEVLATSHTDSLEAKPLESPSLESASSNDAHEKDTKETTPLISKETLGKEKLSTAIPEKHKHGFLYKLNEKRAKFVQGSKDLFHRLDSKFHDTQHTSSIKNEHGLLNIALSNVLMDSVQEVLVTSHTESPQSNPFDFTPTPQSSSNFPEKPSNSLAKLDSEQLCTYNSPSQTHVGQTVNTKLDGAIRDCNNTTHACLTTPRSIETPPADTKTAELMHQRTESLGVRISHSPAKLNSIPCIHRRSSDSDLSITPKGNSLTGSDRSGGYSSGQYMRGAMIRTTRPQENFDIMEYPFLTLSKYPQGFIAHIGGSVSARSVKLLERISNLEEPESRDTWWSEIRMEIRSHARALNCNSVLGYTESTSICDDVCVLSASGTAAVLGCQYSGEAADNIGGLPVLPKANNSTNSTMTTSLDRNDFEKDKLLKEPFVSCIKVEKIEKPKTAPINTSGSNTSPERETPMKPSCTICHLPYFSNSKPLRMSTIKCLTCGAFKVPDMLIATIEMPEGMPNFGRGCFIQSYVCRALKDLKGESYAKEISDGLPFLEYELHRFLINKLKVKGMNAIFGLKVRISIGERMLIGIATGTAVFISALPPPLLPKLVSDRTTDEKKLTQLQKNLHDTIKRNREIYQLRSMDEVANGSSTGKLLLDADDSEEEVAALDLAMGNKDCCILEVDDPDDVDVLNSLMELRPPDGFHVVNTEHVPGLEDLEIVKNLQMFTQIWRAKIPPPFNLDKHFHRLLQSVYFKLRRMIPCALCDLQFRVDSPEPDEIQLCVLGMALGLGDPFKNPKKRKVVIQKRNVTDEDLIFNLEEDQIPEHSIAQTPPTTHLLHAQTLKHRQKSPIRNKILTKQRHVPYRERHGVDITPLSYVPGGKIEKYLGNLNFFLIRETTSLREEGGLSGFVHSFVTEILAIVRAHVTALGGNAMVAYFITECVLNHNLHKNQGQCLINVGGDVVYVSYFNEDH